MLKAKWGADANGYSAKLNGTNGHLFLHDECLTWVPLMSKNAEKIWHIDELVEMKKVSRTGTVLIGRMVSVHDAWPLQ